jgi:hypothetical protein
VSRSPSTEKETVVSVSVVLMVFALGAAAMALWLVVRFPSLGPKRLTGALVLSLAAMAGMQLALQMIDPVAQRGQYGVVLALMLVVLPALTGMFWAAALLLRTLAALRP